MELDLKNSELDDQLKSIEFQINQFNSFGPQKVNILSALSTVTFFLSQQSNYKEMGSKLYDKKFTKVDKKNFSQGYDALTVNYNTLQKNKNDIIIKKKMLYDNLKKTKYYLKGVIIHEGDINYGHYYAYIKNNGRWWQFNDRLVTEVNKRRVFDDAYGYLYEDRNVYCLIYTHEDLDADLQLHKNSLPLNLVKYVNEKNKELRLNEIEKEMDDLIVKMQSRERDIRNVNSYLEFRKLAPRIDCFELFCIDTLNIGVTNPSAYMDAMRVNILDELLAKVKSDNIQNGDINYFTLKRNPEVYRALEKALVKYRIDLPEPSDSCFKMLHKIKNDFINTVKSIIVLGSAAQTLMPRSVEDYLCLLGYYFEIQPFGFCPFNHQQYRMLKENTLYFLIQASYLKQNYKMQFNLHKFVVCMQYCLQILVERKLLDEFPEDFTDSYICFLIDEIDAAINGYPNWINVTELAQQLKNTSNSRKTFTIPPMQKTDYVLVSLEEHNKRS